MRILISLFANLNTDIIDLYYFYLKLQPDIFQFELVHNTITPLKCVKGVFSADVRDLEHTLTKC